ncbi:MAG: hypothetical protein [Wendovervirus sonii]|uniref:Uncharacterized protein n=1 Tax=phage Lak_Megaphage_Sonny TaxID=3109229 RepID=A0ABZ0Z613_9CAUD|nr:MAG: hypothetical protein [phage Lak_Megaphage_Sonny]
MDKIFENYKKVRTFGRISKIVHHFKISIINIILFDKFIEDPIPFTNVKIAHDYCMNSKVISKKVGYKTPELIDNAYSMYDIYTIKTIYNKKIKKINSKFKRYCKDYNLEYHPYSLYIIKNGSKMYYHLHNVQYVEFFEKSHLKSLVNKFEKYVNDLSNKKRSDIKKSILKNSINGIELKRNNLIDDEINRSYEYIKLLDKLKK